MLRRTRIFKSPVRQFFQLTLIRTSSFLSPELVIPTYTLQFRSPSGEFQADTILSQSDNRQTLQAALTSMLQQDTGTAGSIVDISTASSPSSTTKKRKRRQFVDLAFELSVTGNKPCTTVGCLHQFQSRANSVLTNLNRNISVVRYQVDNSSTNYWLTFRLPTSITSSLNLVQRCLVDALACF